MSLLSALLTGADARAPRRAPPRTAAPRSAPSVLTPRGPAPSAPARTEGDFLSVDYLEAAIVRRDREVMDVLGAQEADVHVSMLTKLCARKDALALPTDDPGVKQAWSWDRIIWAMGRACEKHIRDSIIADREGRGVFGVWKCPCERTALTAPDRPDTRCIVCDRPAHDYHEFAIRDPEVGIVGRCDLPIVQNGVMHPVEIKSIKHEEWEGLTSAKGEHEVQVAGYRRLYQRIGWEVSPKVRVIYGSKGAARSGNPYKVFEVDVSGPQWEARMDVIWEQARQRREAIAGGPLPPRCCANPLETRAKNCERAARCWARD